MLLRSVVPGAAVANLVLGTFPAFAQWRGESLNPEGITESQAYAASERRQGGYILVFGEFIYYAHPVVWNARRNDFVDLLPEGWNSGKVYGTDGVFQVGYLSSTLNSTHAILWTGQPKTYISLNPGPDYSAPAAYASNGDQQVGYASFLATGLPHAALWFGTPESFVDLHPTWARHSTAYATDGTYQGGSVDTTEEGGGLHAALWNGSAESFVDMNPEGCLESAILGMGVAKDGTHVQVGRARFFSGEFPALWRGSPESYVNLTPPGARGGRLQATTGDLHCGYANFTGNAEAGVWFGDDPASYVNLETVLGPGWSRSNAKGISVHKGRVYVTGAARSPEGRAEAVLWTARLRKVIGPAG